jgi:predicted ATPase
LDQLPTAKAVAQYSAVIGREFSYELIQSLDLMTERALQEGLNQLIGAELLYQRGRTPHARYQFKHALIQDAAYDSLLRSTRQHIHRQVAQLYEARLSEMIATQPERVAHHYTEAGCHEPAVTYWYRAGQRAAERSEHLTAIIHLRRGIEALSHLPKTSHHIEQELLLHVALGNSLYVVDGYGASEVEQVYQRARELCQHVGDTPQLFQVLRGLFVFYMSRAQAHAAQEVAEQVRRRAHQQPDAGPRLLGYYLLGVALFLRGHFVEASRELEQAIALYDPTAHRDLAHVYSIDIGVGARGFAAATQWMLGFPDRALKLGQETLSLAQTQAHPFSLVFAQSLAQSFLYQLRREVSATYEQAAVGVDLATEQDFTLYVAWCSVYQGWALTMMGQQEEGIAKLRQGMERAADMGTETFQPAFCALLAEATGEAGQPAKALTILAEAQAALARTSECFYEAEVYRLIGVFQLMTSTEGLAEAEAHLRQALEIARRQQARSLELRAATDLARLWQRQGQCTAAYELLAPIYHWFTEGFETGDLQDAKGLLTQMS